MQGLHVFCLRFDEWFHSQVYIFTISLEGESQVQMGYLH